MITKKPEFYILNEAKETISGKYLKYISSEGLFHTGIFLIFYILFILNASRCAHAQVIEEDGIPTILHTETPVNICFSKKTSTGEYISKCEIFHAHDIEKDAGKVGFITEAVTGHVSHEIDSFGVAKWGWWLVGFEILPRAQRQYAQCIERVKIFEQMLRITPLVDHGPLRERIFALMDYVVPFEVMQNIDTLFLPPTKEDALRHLEAAVFTVNLTVADRYGCEYYADSLRRRVNRKFRTRL